MEIIYETAEDLLVEVFNANTGSVCFEIHEVNTEALESLVRDGTFDEPVRDGDEVCVSISDAKLAEMGMKRSEVGIVSL